MAEKDDLGRYRLKLYEDYDHYLQINDPYAIPPDRDMVCFKKGDVLVHHDWLYACVIEGIIVGKPKSLYCRFIYSPDKHIIRETTDWDFDNVCGMLHMTMDKYKKNMIKMKLKQNMVGI